MQLKLQSQRDGLVLIMMTGPLEEYKPSEEIKELFKKTQEVSKKIVDFEKSIESELTEIKQKVEEFNKTQFEEKTEEL